MISIYETPVGMKFKERQLWAKEYFSPWTYERPLLIREATDRHVADLQTILQKSIEHFVLNYDRYAHLMPLTSDVKRVLSFFEGKSYRIGSYRTDFVIDEQLQFKLIEITCRFAFNGYWLSGFLNLLSQDYAGRNQLYVSQPFMTFLEYIYERLKGKEIVILSHKGKSEESRFYQPVLEKAGYQVRKIYLEEIENEVAEVNGKVFITELNQEDYFELSDETLRQLAEAEVMNDLRTVFLIHDKRFLAVLGDAEFRAAVLAKDEIELLDKFYVPTYGQHGAEVQWQEARTQKDHWILKHKHLGKSMKVYAGKLLSETEWQQIFESNEVKDLILQPFIKQPHFKGQIGEKIYKDFVVGTMLFFDDRYFGLGLFRASSHPITNVIDDRKVMHLNVMDNKKYEEFYQL
ncbi:MAG: hypothetical protein AAGI23_15640 [Bacteroidota bacterium]